MDSIYVNVLKHTINTYCRPIVLIEDGSNIRI
jgi:hypothetical protein